MYRETLIEQKKLLEEKQRSCERIDISELMIEKREAEIRTLENKIADLRNYDEVCKKRREELKNTSEMIETILAEGQISNVNLRMIVRRVTVYHRRNYTD